MAFFLKETSNTKPNSHLVQRRLLSISHEKTIIIGASLMKTPLEEVVEEIKSRIS